MSPPSQGYPVLLPGKCWAFHGVQGTLTISLSHPVRITHVTLDHLPRYISPTGRIDSAPKDFEVYVSTSHTVSCHPLYIALLRSYHSVINYPIQTLNTCHFDAVIFFSQGMKSYTEKGTLLGTFTYNEKGESSQTFQLPVSSNKQIQIFKDTMIFTERKNMT